MFDVYFEMRCFEVGNFVVDHGEVEAGIHLCAENTVNKLKTKTNDLAYGGLKLNASFI